MSDFDARIIMIWIAVITPLLAAAIYAVGRAGQTDAEPLPKSYVRNVLILAAAGPINFAIWLLHNQWADRSGPGSVYGIILAAIVFIAAGFATGLFARLRNR
ncbi:MAG: hypothetical protein LLG00_15425 [Planctomycetaceae bacterium]|nr:hypothetical protein [Planctomycetaceae bacterium]